MIIVDPPLGRIGIARIVLGAIGVGLIVTGGLFALLMVPADRYPAIVVWLVAVVVAHDGVIAPLVALIALSSAHTAQRIGAGAAAVARTALCVAAICSLIAVPGIVVRALGPRNPTIHATDYTTVMAVIWCGAVVIALGAALVGGIRQRPARTK